MGIEGIKQQGREADHPRPSSVEIKNGGATPLLLHTLVVKFSVVPGTKYSSVGFT
jgi:hypothetical protein